MTQPILTVELGVLSGWELGTSILGTDTYLATVSYDYDISDRVRSVSIRRGRQHELNRVEAGTASVTVLNQDGAFNPWNTSSEFYPAIKPMTYIRIRVASGDATVTLAPASLSFAGRTVTLVGVPLIVPITAGSVSWTGRSVTVSIPTFAPDDISGLKAWYDFSDISTLWQDSGLTTQVTTDGQTIGSVTDKSAAAHDLTVPSSTSEPAYRTAIISGRSVARFDGVDNFLGQASSWSADSTFTVFVVSQKTSAITSATDVLFEMASNASLYTDSTDSATAYVWQQDSGGSPVAVGGTPTNVTCMVLRINSASSMNVYANGGTATTFDPNDAVTTGTALRLGATLAGSGFGDYDVGEVVVYDSALSTANMNTVGNYLAGRWGFSWTTV